MSGRCCQGQTPSRDIPGPGKRLALPDGAPLPPGDYSTTPGGTVFGTTPGGERLGCGPGVELRGLAWVGALRWGRGVGSFGRGFLLYGGPRGPAGPCGALGAALALPGLGFVFSSFSTSYEISPAAEKIDVRGGNDETALEAVPGEQTERRQRVVFCEPFRRVFPLQHKVFRGAKCRENGEVGAADAGVCFGLGN